MTTIRSRIKVQSQHAYACLMTSLRRREKNNNVYTRQYIKLRPVRMNRHLWPSLAVPGVQHRGTVEQIMCNIYYAARIIYTHVIQISTFCMPTCPHIVPVYKWTYGSSSEWVRGEDEEYFYWIRSLYMYLYATYGQDEVYV